MSGNINDPSSWAPPGESPQQLWIERSNFAGIVLSSVAYGVHLTLYLFVAHHLVRHPTRRSPVAGSGSKSHVSWPLVLYISTNFLLGTIGIAAEARFNEMTFIDDRNFPGGPAMFISLKYSDFVNMFGTAAYVVLNWFADGLVIYRFWLIYNFNYWVAFFPCLLLMGSVAMGCILLFQLTQPNANLWTVTTVNFGIPYWSISASLNILVTSLIVAKLFLIRRRTRAVLSTHHSRTYTSVAAMLVESAALYSACALLFIITYAQNSQIQNLVLPVLGQVQAISPLLIMWRVARGQAISRETRGNGGGGGGGGGGGSSDPAGTTPSKLSWRRTFSNLGASSQGSHKSFNAGGGGARKGGYELRTANGDAASSYYEEDDEGVMELDSTFSTGTGGGASVSVSTSTGSRTTGGSGSVSMSMAPLARRVVLAPLKKARFGSIDRSAQARAVARREKDLETGAGDYFRGGGGGGGGLGGGGGGYEALESPTVSTERVLEGSETSEKERTASQARSHCGPPTLTLTPTVGRIEVRVERQVLSASSSASVWESDSERTAGVAI